MTGAVVCARTLDWGRQERLVIRLRSVYIGHLSPGAHGTDRRMRQDWLWMVVVLSPGGKVCMGGCLCGVNLQHRRTSDEGGEGSSLVEQTEGLYVVN